MKKARNKSTRELKSIVKRYTEKELTAEDVVEMLPNDNDMDKFIDMLIDYEEYYDAMMADGEEDE